MRIKDHSGWGSDQKQTHLKAGLHLWVLDLYSSQVGGAGASTSTGVKTDQKVALCLQKRSVGPSFSLCTFSAVYFHNLLHLYGIEEATLRKCFVKVWF